MGPTVSCFPSPLLVRICGFLTLCCCSPYPMTYVPGVRGISLDSEVKDGNLVDFWISSSFEPFIYELWLYCSPILGHYPSLIPGRTLWIPRTCHSQCSPSYHYRGDKAKAAYVVGVIFFSRNKVFINKVFPSPVRCRPYKFNQLRLPRFQVCPKHCQDQERRKVLASGVKFIACS